MNLTEIVPDSANVFTTKSATRGASERNEGGGWHAKATAAAPAAAPIAATMLES